MTIAVKDATEIWRDGRFRWAAGLLFLLILAAVAGGVHNQSQIARQHADAQRAERDVWLDKGDMNPHAAAHYGAFVFKPVQPLSAIDPGLDPFVGVFVFLEAHKQQLARHRPIEDATPTRRLGQLTPASAALVLLPLLVVTLTFSSFAAERESGTLRPLMAMGVSRGSLVGRQGDWRGVAARRSDRPGGGDRRADRVLERSARSGCADRVAGDRYRHGLPGAHADLGGARPRRISAGPHPGSGAGRAAGLVVRQRLHHAAAGDGGGEMDRSVAVCDSSSRHRSPTRRTRGRRGMRGSIA